MRQTAANSAAVPGATARLIAEKTKKNNATAVWRDDVAEERYRTSVAAWNWRRRKLSLLPADRKRAGKVPMAAAQKSDDSPVTPTTLPASADDDDDERIKCVTDVASAESTPSVHQNGETPAAAANASHYCLMNKIPILLKYRWSHGGPATGRYWIMTIYYYKTLVAHLKAQLVKKPKKQKKKTCKMLKMINF